MNNHIEHDMNNSCFYIKENERLRGEMKYMIENNIMSINHTYVNPEYRGHGYAKQLVEAGIEYAKNKQLKIRPACSYAYTVMEANYPDLIIRT